VLDPTVPADAQRVVAAYLSFVEAQAAANIYPGSLRDLPHSRENIRTAFKTSTMALVDSGQMTADLRDYLEIAYVSLADYLDDEGATLLREYVRAGEDLTAHTGLPRDRVTTDAWRRVSDQSRLAGELARAISVHADELRSEFRSWHSDDPSVRSSAS
jgi:hypothetical protein